MSPGFASFFSSCTMNCDVRRVVLPYSPSRTCHSTATVTLFCILLLTTTPVFSDFCDIRVPYGREGRPSCLSCPFLSEHGLHAREIAAHHAHLVGHLELPHRLLNAH